MIMIFQLSDWFPKEKLMANFLCWNFGGRKKFFRGIVGKENVTIWFAEVSPDEIKRIAYGLVGYIYQLISGASSKNNC